MPGKFYMICPRCRNKTFVVITFCELLEMSGQNFMHISANRLSVINRLLNVPKEYLANYVTDAGICVSQATFTVNYS